METQNVKHPKTGQIVELKVAQRELLKAEGFGLALLSAQWKKAIDQRNWRMQEAA